MIVNVIEYLRNTIETYPDRTAVIEGERRISFAELDDRCRRLASCLYRKDRTLVNRPVAVYLPKNIECVVSDIGILYSGNAYMNLDVKAPEHRIQNTLEQIRPACIITDRKHGRDVPQGHGTILYLEDLEAEAPEPEDPKTLMQRLSHLIDTDPLCIINTSGSTGIPKGVILNHRSFIDFTEWAVETLQIGEAETVGSLSPAVFDIYSFELCMLMARGSTILLLPEAMSAFPAKLLQEMKANGVSFIFWVPTIMVNIANMDLLSRIHLPDLRTVWFAGEVFPTKSFNYWKRHLRETTFVNLYGPIEITLDCTYYIVDGELPEEEPIPIGFPCRNTDILLLKEDDTPAAPGEEGEICVRGTSLAMGYYRNSEKTAAAFVQNPLNHSYPELIYRTGDMAYLNEAGAYVFKGRRDTLIKHMGYRIELSELEHIAGYALEEIENCCVLYDAGAKEIILVYEAGEEMEPARLRKSLARHCPKYMLPVTYIRLAKLPVNTNGKVDRLKTREIIGR